MILDTISNEARQQHTILLEDSTPVVLNLTYRATQLGWFVDVIYENKNFSTYGLRITTNTNILNQWRNIIPFGLMCYTEDTQEPLSIQDFLVGRAHLSILNENEVKQIAELERE